MIIYEIIYVFHMIFVANYRSIMIIKRCTSALWRIRKKNKPKKNTEKTEDVEKPKINIYEREDVEMSKTNIKGDVVKVYFTGLYTPGTYQGLKNGLYV